MGVGPLRGANVTTFWIFRQVSDQFKPILMPPATAHTLEIMRKFSNGLRDLQLMSATAVTVSLVRLKFDGAAYKQSAATLEHLP